MVLVRITLPNFAHIFKEYHFVHGSGKSLMERDNLKAPVFILKSGCER